MAMDLTSVRQMAHAVLYEGYLLYPYRASSVKNRLRWTFGCLFPPAYCAAQQGAEADQMQTQCLLLGETETSLTIVVCFLHLRTRTDGEPWQEADEREVAIEGLRLGDITAEPRRHAFTFSATPTAGGRWEQQSLRGDLMISARWLRDGVCELTVRTTNMTPFADVGASRDHAVCAALVSCHCIIGLQGGEFVSTLDPPAELAEATACCRNVGVWPVLAGDPSRRDIVLAAPIILPEFPRIAPHSPGDLFDATEIDELLTLRILTLTDEEKQQMRATDERGRALLERTEALDSDQLRRLHGAVSFSGNPLRPGMRVRLRPRRRADVFDLALAGRTAMIASLEETIDGQTLLTVVVEDDPGRDLGLAGQPGHRFFFLPDEVEVIDRKEL